jgi:hypothetical protein
VPAGWYGKCLDNFGHSHCSLFNKTKSSAPFYNSGNQERIMKIKRLVSSGISLVVAVILSSFLTLQAMGQTGASGVSGTVQDPQGNAIANATVRLINDEKGFSRTLTTSADGTFNFASIPPDTYRIEVEASGFKRSVLTNIGALIDKPTEANVILEIGSVNETVSITADAIESIINTQDASLGNTFQARQIQELPTDLRNIPSLLSLQPGVTRQGYVNGGRSDQANITLDGIDTNEQQTGAAFSSVLRITAESIEEFRVTTSNPNAAQGRSSGAQISLSTKGGTNEFRGALFEFYRPTFGSANTFFNNRDGVERPSLARHVFGGAIGGPIVKNKAFFFYSFEGQRERSETSVTQIVPLASLGSGEFRARDVNGNVVSLNLAQLNTIYATAGINPAALAILASAASRYPANDTSQGDQLNTGGFRFNAKTPEDLNTHIARFDYNINANQTFFARANYQNDSTVLAQAFPDTPSPELWSHNTGLAVGHNWTIGNNKVNSFRYGLTRQAFTSGGDATENLVSFRFVYTPLNYSYTLSRVTPVHNFTDDFTWTTGNHTVQFGGNFRIIRNKRSDSGPAFDTAVINPSYYSGSGRSLITPLRNAGHNISSTNLDAQAAIAALIGRFSQYNANYNYDLSGNVLPTGTAIERTFASEEYELYAQDSWKIRQDLTLNFGLRYSLSRPVYETEGYQIRPTIPLGDYFEQRVESSQNGKAFNDLIQFELAGPKHGKPGFYNWDKNNLQPRISAAWSPGFKSGFLGKLFGTDNESVFRGGFSVLNDYFGQQLAVTFNNLSTLGFTTASEIGPNTYNVTSSLGPRFTGLGQRINNFPGIQPLANRFQTPADETTRIESSLDSTLVSPTHYNWSLTYGRRLPAGLYVEASYVGRRARNLLATRDIMAFNNLVDPKSGEDWYTAAGKIYDLYYSNANPNSVAPIPYFENLFPGIGAVFYNNPNLSATQTALRLTRDETFGDWTYLQQLLDDDFSGQDRWANVFIHPQYAAFSAFSTIAKSNYHGGNLTVRQRLSTALTLDFNYTFAKSMDDASGLQTSGTYGSALILNPLRQQDSYAPSDFDVRHTINANAIWQIPIGRDRRFFGGMNRWADAVVGGWQLAGIYRWNTGLPFSNLIDLAGWATNWQIRSRAVRTKPIQTSITRGENGQPPNAFSNLDDLINSVRPPRPGETGDRNVFRGPGYSALDMSLSKVFMMPWSENHKLQFRWEVFNVFNRQYFSNASISAFSITPDIPLSNSQLTSGTGVFTDIQGAPRRMQFGLRYSF